jgi:large subunit ribosomal protein L21
MFCVVTIVGKQYNVAPGDTIEVAFMEGKVGDKLTLDHVLLVSDGKKTKIGTPTVKGAKVTAEITGQGKGEKLNVRRFKSKVRHRRSIGFRPLVTTLKIATIA